MDAAEYKHVVFGMILLKYISDALEEMHGWLAVLQLSGLSFRADKENHIINAGV